MRRVLSVFLLTTIGFGQMPAVARDKPDETDSLMLAQAKSACAAGEFKSFLEAYARSLAVRAVYTAAEVSVSVNGKTAQVAREAYAGFPIALIDYYWVSATSAKAVLAGPGAELEYLKMEWNQSQTNIWRIDWQRVRYDGKSEGGDDLGKETGTYGEPGYVLFNPTDTCWELTQDTVGGPGTGLSEP